MWTFASACMVGSGVSAALALQFIDAPYGKFAPDKASKWGPLLPARWGWLLQESPALLLMLLYWTTLAHPANAAQTPNHILAALFCFHYVVRAWIFPFLLNQSKPSPLSVVAIAFVFCMVNGWLQGSYLFQSPDAAAYPSDWLHSWRVRVGLALFAFGWCANQHADYVLRNLRGRPKQSDDKARKDGSESERETRAADPAHRYKIPYGGLFRWVSAANYCGEIIEWGGFALAAWSVPAVAFWLFTMANLVPRAVSYHRWYKRTFPNYPRDRKAVIPFIL